MLPMTDITVVNNVPGKWADGTSVLRMNRLYIALLRVAGCSCELPLIRNARDENWDFNDGPRCKVCNRQVTLVLPITEEVLAYKRRSHQAMVQFERSHPGEFAAAFNGWVSECFTGCGCEPANE